MIRKACTTPSTLEANIQFKGVSHTKKTTKAVIRKERGMAFEAGQRKPTINTNIATMGITAKRARCPIDIIIFFNSLLKNKI
jgi:hypothetical protein